jgi:2-C-methyl-D-erythritol 4-phosphate cytidylyltransferase
MQKIVAIVVAAGTGSRMGAGINKQFINIKDKPLLYYTLLAFESNSEIDEIVVTAKMEEIQYIKDSIIAKYRFHKIVDIIVGGKERQDSVYNALKSIKKCDIVLIHDGARPFVTNQIIQDGIEYTRLYGAAACGVVPKDTVKCRDNEGFSKGTLNREELFNVQTPQCFNYKLIVEAHEKCHDNNMRVTDDTAVLEYLGHKIYLYQGSYDNIKVTTPEDLAIADRLVEKKTNT